MKRKYFAVIFILRTLHMSCCQQYITQTVYGFLDFTTTIGNTVMVFSPQSATVDLPSSSQSQKANIIRTESNSQILIEPSETGILYFQKSKLKYVVPTAIHIVGISSEKQDNKYSSSVVEEVVLSKTKLATTGKIFKKENVNLDSKPSLNDDDYQPAKALTNDLVQPEYDFLSREPSEFAEETYIVTNIKPSHRIKNDEKKRQSSQAKDILQPIGLVTKLGGTIVIEGTTTVHETSVIGTYISGKYAQILQSSSKIFKKILPKASTTPTLRVLKTAVPTPPSSNKHRAELLSSHDEQGNSKNRRPGSHGNFKTRPKKSHSEEHENITSMISSPGSISTPKSVRHRNKSKNRRNKSTRSSHKASVATTAFIAPVENNYSRRTFKPRIQSTTVELNQQEITSVYKFKLNRSPGRWQYKTTPKPRVTIRKSNLDDASDSNIGEVLSNDIPIENANTRNDEVDLDSLGSISSGALNSIDKIEKNEPKKDKKLPVETLNVEISTPLNFKNTYYEIATIKTPFTFQVGTVKNTRYITLTSTLEKTLDPEPSVSSTLTEPLMENIFTSSNKYLDQSFLESSIITLNPVHLLNDEETPALETTIETFSTTQKILKTQLLPVVANVTKTTTMTFIQTYHIIRLTTATKTLAPLEAYHKYKDFSGKLEEAGSEINLELDFGDEQNGEDPAAIKRFPLESDIEMAVADLDLIGIRQGESKDKNEKSNKFSNQNLQTDVLQNNLSPEQIHQLALLKILNPQFPQIVTTSKPVLKFQTLFESHIITIQNSQTTSYSTISKVVGTITKTEFEYGTSTISLLSIPQIPLNPLNPLFPQQQPQFHITSTPMIKQTIITQTESKVLKLTFGAKTAYTTLFSTNVIPTVLTSYVTTTIPFQPTGAFPGYFPAPFAPYPFVG